MEWNPMFLSRRARILPSVTPPASGFTEGRISSVGTFLTKSHPGVRHRRGEHGLSLVELIVTVAILAILSTVVYPIARFQVRRHKEQVLHDELWQMRHAIDLYKDAADRGGIRVDVDSAGYPPDMDTLVKGVDIQGHKVKFLREIPTDPMTGKKDWVFRSMQDDPDSDSWGGQNVFDVHSNSQGTGLDGTKYSTW
ncbi:MAG TPA: type II secretion system protein [Acidobacteriaceae bacterium]|nr:type II secretion system protein [Acidobacteriaceae bacterium]